MALTTLPTVRFALITPDLVTILRALLRVESHATVPPSGLMITSGSDGQHMVGSKHYTGQAVDIRTKNFASPTAIHEFMAVLQQELGPRFSLLHEDAGMPNQHLHVQVAKGITSVGRV